MTAINDDSSSGSADSGSADMFSASARADLMTTIIRSQRSAFAQAHLAKCAADAISIRVLHVAHELAMASAANDSTPKIGPTSAEQVQGWHLRAIVGEFAIETNKSDASLVHRARHAHALVTHYPHWVDELEAGRIEYAHTLGVVRHDELLTDAQRVEYGASVLKYALRHTSGQTNRFAEREAARIAHEEFSRAHELACTGRRVSVSHEPAGMSTIYATLPTVLAVPIDDLLTRQARALRNENKAEIAGNAKLARSADPVDRARAAAFVADSRTVEQIRADLFADVLLTSTPQAILNGAAQGAARVKATFSVIVPALALLDPSVSAEVDGLSAETTMSAVLNGLHPMTADQARQLASEQPSLQRLLTHPVTGHAVSVDSYEPPASLRAFLRCRDEICRFPGCTRAAASTDLDHTVAYVDGGPTAEWNLGHLCRIHHVQKHHRGWYVEQLAVGVLRWTSPNGQVVTTEPRPPGPVFRPTSTAAPPDMSVSSDDDRSGEVKPGDDPPPF